ncbi:MAG: hypothetical protein A2288_02650 [Candidatus Moranbacteria bacterium RIFOXYA12_FULL_44_15]|nr:MAG: hypothetical protein A2288_02650 [Candidatus Moranbacteria bacterium RIFOXYA12_FULL_44_15]OGI35213.1 MAG: hypothetical protein A2259_02775 [Candidatus Moranbacteria bacterium RIFOXYA2_FULL_43_15]
MNIEKLKKILEEAGEPKFRLAQVKKAVFKDSVSSFADISTLSKNLRSLLEKEFKILSFDIEEIKTSGNKFSVKALLRLPDGNFTETVLLASREGNWSVCLSCQAGCPLNCAFCATGKGGFKRDLTGEEITDQILFWRGWLKNDSTRALSCPDEYVGASSPDYGRGGSLSNIVFMGMGEPFLNWENVKKSLRDLTDPELFGFGSRAISVSTAGLPEGILKLAADFPQINLAVSLHFAEDVKRSQFMPINKKHNLAALKEALRQYFLKTRRKVMLEYIMLSGINDSLADAEKLAAYVKSIGKLQLLHVNLISYNDTSGEFSVSSAKAISRFQNYLIQNRINTTMRKSLGGDVEGACGQLAGKRSMI